MSTTLCGPWTTDTTGVLTDSTEALTDGSIGGLPGAAVAALAVSVEERMCRVATQFRESPNFLAMAQIYMEEVAEPIIHARLLPCFFDLDTAVSDQLTIIGGWLGFPRCHCICIPQPVFGFGCDGEQDQTGATVVGFCEDGTWADCNEVQSGDICIFDDETYRKFLRVRLYQAQALFDATSLQEAAQIMWGPDTLIVEDEGAAVVWPRRILTDEEERLLSIAFRVLPIAPGIRGRIQKGAGEVFGFGEGWAGFCDGEPDVCESMWTFCDEADGPFCQTPAPEGEGCEWEFGFCDDRYGFCEEDRASVWWCPEDPLPYSCGPEQPVFGFSGEGKSYAGFCQNAVWKC